MRTTAAQGVEQLVTRYSARSVAAGAGRISYRESGAGAPLVLLHGIGSGSASWAHQLEGLAARYRVVAWDAPGYSGSTCLGAESPTASDYAAALASLLDALGIQRAIVVGHSLGAIVATRFAAAAPARVDRLVLLDPARGHGGSPAEIRARKLHERVAAMEKLGPFEHARQRSTALLAPHASQAARELVIWNAARLDPAGYAQAARMLAEADICGDAAGYDGFVLVACGTEDRVTPEAACRPIAGAFRRAEYRSLPGLGHASYIEDPAAVNALIVAFTSSPVPA